MRTMRSSCTRELRCPVGSASASTWAISVLHPLDITIRGRRGTSHPRDDTARERLGHAPFLVDADGEHQFLKSLTLELADLLDQRLGRADQAGGADEAGVDQLGFPRVQIGVVELVRAEMPVRGWRLLHERAVALPDRTQGPGR